MPYVKPFHQFIFEQHIQEGVMGDLHQLAQEAKDADDFVKRFFAEHGREIKRDRASEAWVKKLYADTVQESEAYFKGISKSTAAKKKAQMKRQAEMPDDDPAAYFESILLEIGDSSAPPYDWSHTIQSKKGTNRFKGIIPKNEQFWYDQYDFQTESGLIYIVTVNKKLVRGDERPTSFISFEASEGDWEKTSHNDTFTRGEMYRVMATIMEITKDYTKNNPNLQTLSMNPVKNYEKDERRKKLYLAYIKKNMPANASVKEVGDKIEINFS